MKHSKIATLVGSLVLASMLTACGAGGEEGAAPASGTAAVETPVVAPVAAAPVGGGYPAATPTPAPAAEVTQPQVQIQTPVVQPVTQTPVVQVVVPTSAPVVQTPVIAVPATTGRVGVAYSFAPAAIDANGDKLTFTITGKPSWAAFDANTGKLTGIPASGDIGSFNNISIKVSDGKLTASLASFGIIVSASNNGSATLSWSPPTQNTDGSSLSNLGGYRIYYGTQQNALNQSIQVTNPGLTSYTVGNLTTGNKYYFAIAAYTADGVEGAASTVGSKTL